MKQDEIILPKDLTIDLYLKADHLSGGECGVILSRAGVGKTALLAQLAIHYQLDKIPVLHVSFNEPVKKVCLRYDEYLHSIDQSGGEQSTRDLSQNMLAYRFIMTFKRDVFNVVKLEDRINELADQGIFDPKVIIIDVLPMEVGLEKVISDLKEFSKRRKLPIWFAFRTHREDQIDADGLPVSFAPFNQYFEVIWQLLPEGMEIDIQRLRSKQSDPNLPKLVLDPSTMMIKVSK